MHTKYMREKIFRNDFKKNKELSKENIKREIGDLRIERKEVDQETGEAIDYIEKIEARKAGNFLEDEVIESGDRITGKGFEDKLKKHGLKNEQISKRKKIINLFKRALGLEKKKDNYSEMKRKKIENEKRAQIFLQQELDRKRKEEKTQKEQRERMWANKKADDYPEKEEAA